MTQATSALTPEMQSQLEQLKDIHLPEPISWWPLAIGWWIVIALFLIAAIVGVWWLMNRRARLRKNVIAELQNVSRDNPVQCASELSSLLRRVAICCNANRYSVRNISGEKWAEFLSQGEHGIDKRLAIIIANTPYSNAVSNEFDADALIKESELWITQQLKRRQK